MGISGLLTPLRSLIAWIGNFQSAAVLQERLALLKSKNEILEKELVDLKKEYAELVDRNKALEADLAKHLIPSDYVEQSGALFKRKPEGHGYDTTPRCPVCHSAMNSRLNIAIFECGSPKCGHRAGFSGAELGEVMDRLP